MSQFFIPAGSVYNFARSYISFDATFPTTAADEITAATLNNVVHTDKIPIDNLQLQTNTGKVLANIQYADLYSKVSALITTDLDEYQDRPGIYGAGSYVTDSAVPVGRTSVGMLNTNYCCNPCKVPLSVQGASGQLNQATLAGGAVSAATAATSPMIYHYPSASYTTCAATAVAPVLSGCIPAQVITATVRLMNAPAANSGADTDLFSQQHLVSSGMFWQLTSVQQVSATMTVRYFIPLKSFLGTILAMDKDLWFPQQLQLIINWSRLSKWGFKATAAAVANIVSLAAPTITNYRLNMASDCVQENVDSLRLQAMQGIDLIVPWSVINSQAVNPAVGSVVTFPQTLSSGMGITCKRVISFVVDGANDLNTAGSMENVSAVRYTTVQTFLDSIPRQIQPLQVANNDDFTYQNFMINKSPAAISTRNFYITPFFIDNFSDSDHCSKFKYNDTCESGLELLPVQRSYMTQYTMNTVVPQTIYTIGTFIRNMKITSDDIFI